MSFDPTTDIGKIRLRIADWSDIPILSDAIIQSTLDDNDSNVPNTARVCAQYILGMLAGKVHRKLGLQLEVFGSEWYQNYKDFLVLTVSNPAFMSFSPVPVGTVDDFNTIIQFQSDWNKNYFEGTQSQQLASDAAASPNQGGLYGPTLDSARWAD